MRSECKQQKHNSTIVEALAADQTFFDPEQVEGSMVDVYCPPHLADLNNADWHFHFMTADCTQGRHTLDCSLNKAEATMDLTVEFGSALCDAEKLEDTGFTVDRSSDMGKAETNEG